MIADQDPSVRRMIARVLETADYDVTPVGSAGEAERRFETESPDLLLLDMSWPDQNSWEVWAALHRRKARVPVIAMTASPGQSQQAERVGANALLEKPLDIARLLGIAGRLLAGTA